MGVRERRELCRGIRVGDETSLAGSGRTGLDARLLGCVGLLPCGPLAAVVLGLSKWQLSSGLKQVEWALDLGLRLCSKMGLSLW